MLGFFPISPFLSSHLHFLPPGRFRCGGRCAYNTIITLYSCHIHQHQCMVFSLVWFHSNKQNDCYTSQGVNCITFSWYGIIICHIEIMEDLVCRISPHFSIKHRVIITFSFSENLLVIQKQNIIQKHRIIQFETVLFVVCCVLQCVVAEERCDTVSTNTPFILNLGQLLCSYQLVVRVGAPFRSEVLTAITRAFLTAWFVWTDVVLYRVSTSMQ